MTSLVHDDIWHDSSLEEFNTSTEGMRKLTPARKTWHFKQHNCYRKALVLWWKCFTGIIRCNDINGLSLRYRAGLKSGPQVARMFHFQTNFSKFHQIWRPHFSPSLYKFDSSLRSPPPGAFCFLSRRWCGRCGSPLWGTASSESKFFSCSDSTCRSILI